MKVSVVIPVFNEADNIPILSSELSRISNPSHSFEFLFVDDGSTDRTWVEIQTTSKSNSAFVGARNPINRGQSAAMLLGFSRASGDIIVTMDGDLQNNPADIPKLVQHLIESNADVVCGIRTKRRDAWSRRIGSKIGNSIRNSITRDGLVDTGCSLKAFRRECVKDIPTLHGAHRFMGAYFKLHGRKIEQLNVDHRPRTHGLSKYTNLKRLPKTAFDLIGFIWYRSRLIRD